MSATPNTAAAFVRHGSQRAEEIHAYNPPAWFDELASAQHYAQHIVLSGNIRDLYPLKDNGVQAFPGLEQTLSSLLARHGIACLMTYCQASGLQLPDDQLPKLAPLLERAGVKQGQRFDTLKDLSDFLAHVMAFADARVALVLDYASHLQEDMPGDLDQFFVSVDVASGMPSVNVAPQARRNPILWLVDHPADLPDWFAIGNNILRDIRIELPNLEDRYLYADLLAREFGWDQPNQPETGFHQLQQFALECDGETLVTMHSIAKIAAAEQIRLDRISEAIRIYRTGIRRNPWTSRVLFDRVRQARTMLERRIKGQDHAIEKTLDILSRSVIGLSGAQSGPRHSRPRGILFLAGPTGVGKTELAKAITELLFGDETACHRFDMSEFMEEDSVSRLIGAPPGHPGHERGGELVNAAHRRPFSVFLFDEVEKAHPRILDVFLQILDEGRLTDSRGATAHFTEALIVFTSNIGMVTGSRASNLGMNVLPSDSHKELEKKINAAVQDHFRTELKRPELMNRIGQNVVVFDFLSAEAAGLIFDAFLGRVLQAISSQHGVVVDVTDPVRQTLKTHCTRDFFEGGRGIGNRVETHFINPLSRQMFENGAVEDVRVTAISIDSDRTTLTLEPLTPGGVENPQDSPENRIEAGE